MKNFLTALLIIAILFFVGQNCKKTGSTGNNSNSSNNNNNNNNTDYPTDPDAIVTSVGSPAGTPVVQNISNSGGTVSSADGILDVIIPSGALTKMTPISITPITNVLPGSIYDAYTLSPDGQQFQQPVTLQFHYKEQDLDTTDPGGLAIAFQLHDGTWEGFQNSIVDTASKTVSIQSSHFTDFTMAAGDRLTPGFSAVKTGGQVSILHVTNFSRRNSNNVELAPMVNSTSPYGAHNGDVWTINGQVNGGSGIYGTIIPPTGNRAATFVAPSKLPSPNIVIVRKTYFYKPAVGQVSVHDVTARVKILWNPKWRLDVVNTVKDSYVKGVTFTDSSSVIITINPDSTVAMGDTYNGPPSVSKDPQTILNCTYTFVKDPVGPVNITNITGNLKYYATGQYLLTMIVYIDAGTGARWHVVCSGVGTTPDQVAPNANGVYPFPFFVSLDNPQVEILGDANNGTYARLTPITDQ